MLAAREIYKSFGREMVLRGACLTIEANELVGLIGASGAGKTVLARCLIGLETWDRGRLVVDDMTIDSPYPIDDPRWLNVRHKVGLVAQNRALPPYRTAYAQILEGPKFVKRISHKEVALKVKQWIERFGLSSHLHKYPHELSGGQLARVCLARALVMEPRYLICDEITAGLDPITASEVATALLEVVNSGVGLLLISHQIEFLKHYATRVDFLQSGQIVASGVPENMLVAPKHKGLREFLTDITLGR